MGSGHPLADIFLLKYQPRYLEVSEGVSFFGRAGAAVLRSIDRLSLDPLLLYGTNAVKCANVDAAECEANCPPYLLEEFQITRPKMLVVMGSAHSMCSTATSRRACGSWPGYRGSCRSSPPSAGRS